MSELRISAGMDVHEGKLDEFHAIAAKCLQAVRDKDSGTLQYDWYHNDDHSKYIVLERYRDSEAVLEHFESLGDLLGELLETCGLEVDVFGTPSAELVEAAAAIPTRVYSFHQGL